MKIYKYLLIISMLSIATGCGEWLDVTPKTQVGIEKIFSSEKGYENVLIGCYSSMSDTEIYGCDMTLGMFDAMAQYYDITDDSKPYYEASKFNFGTSQNKNTLENLWLKSYFTIANCNVILDNLKTANESIFINRHDVLIEAEAKALRAFMHLNLLRAFAPTWRDGADSYVIPYANEFRSTPFQQIKMRDFMTLLIQDLKDSYELLKDIDPLFNEKFSESEYYRWDLMIHGQQVFQSFRAFRMNYYAVTGMLARAYIFMGDKENAYKYAEEVINNKDKFRFIKETELRGDEDKRDAVFKSEILFGLQDKEIHKIFQSLQNKGYVPYKYQEVFPEGANDYRCLYSMSTKDQGYTLKYYGSSRIIVPMIRFSEMYLIAAEAIFEKDNELGERYLTTLRRNRGLSELTSTTIYDDFMKSVTLEARREFFGEGQMFYWYKRLGMNPLRGDNPVDISAKKMILPVPSVEVEFGNYNLQ